MADPAAVTDFLGEFPQGIATLTEALRGLIREAIPTASERLLPGWRALGYRDAQAGHFCGLFPTHRAVRLYLEHGAALEARGLDSHGLLRGEATMRRGRYVEFVPGKLPSARSRRAVKAMLVALVTAASV